MIVTMVLMIMIMINFRRIEYIQTMKQKVLGILHQFCFNPLLPLKRKVFHFVHLQQGRRFCGASANHREYTKNVVNKPALHESDTDVDMRDSSCMSCEGTEPTSTK
ncbi:uncharacterized protein DS421_3g63950 [Arachis hypogaea]|nr:uncharacterized protein DS421_3g63950 [Arachis hypogaea]